MFYLTCKQNITPLSLLVGMTVKRWFCCCYSLFIVLPLFVVLCVRSLFCYAVLCVLSSFAVISLGMRRLIALLLLSFNSVLMAVTVLCFFLTILCVGLQCVFVTFPHILTCFFIYSLDVTVILTTSSQPNPC